MCPSLGPLVGRVTSGAEVETLGHREHSSAMGLEEQRGQLAKQGARLQPCCLNVSSVQLNCSRIQPAKR